MAKFVDDNYWVNRAHEEAVENRKLKYQQGSGPCVMFALDTSGSMAGEGFQQMKRAFTDIIDEYAKGHMDETVAVVTFGEEVRFRHYYSNNYQSLKRCLDGMDCKGASPIKAAITLCLSGLLFGGGYTTEIGTFQVEAKLILITDGKPTTSNMIGGEEDEDFMDPVETRKSLMNLIGDIGRGISLNCIPVGEDPDFCLLGSIAYSSRGGKLIQPQQATQYGRYHANMRHISKKLAKGCVYGRKEQNQILQNIPDKKFSQGDLELAMFSTGIMNQSTDEDRDDILELISEKTTYKRKPGIVNEDNDDDENCEFNPEMLPVGTRVRRGPDWRWGDQDCHGPGTVVNHNDNGRDGWLRVVWDTGSSFPYRYGSIGMFENFDLVECDEPRILNDELIAVGCLVERGPDWQWEDQDGGKGNIGVVYKTKRNAVVYVRWPNSNKSNYRFGYDGKFDVQLCDPFDSDVVKRLQQQKQDAGEMSSSKLANETNAVKLKLLYLQAPESREDEKESKNISSRDSIVTPFVNRPVLSSIRNQNVTTNDDPGDVYHFCGRSGSIDDELNDEIKIDFPHTDIWQFKGEDGQWKNFPKDINQKIDSNYRKNNKGTVLVNIRDSWYRIVSSKMKMIDIKSRHSTDIRYLEGRTDKDH
ncbi:uncharacterized protein LOC133181481 [Saccostrea echinata]|uniref:uncharacterized protein LOC133181481 n=1 Tax=Saccostrea echinata TaxID=191078 RepID=UPI002A81E5B7|nr:uncharacterized protein LOC133181481 [Saccostrea echinata]